MTSNAPPTRPTKDLSISKEPSDEEEESPEYDATSSASSSSFGEDLVTPLADMVSIPLADMVSTLLPYRNNQLNNEKVRLRNFIDTLGTGEQMDVMMAMKLEISVWTNRCNLKSDLEDILVREIVYGMAFMWWDRKRSKYRGVKVLKGVVQKCKSLLGPWRRTTLNAMDFLAISLADVGQYEEATWVWMDMVTETKSWNASRGILEKEALLGQKWINILAPQEPTTLDPLVLKNPASYKLMAEVTKEAKAALGESHKMVDMFNRTMNSKRLVFLVGKQGNVDNRKDIFEWVFDIVDKPWHYNKPITI